MLFQRALFAVEHHDSKAIDLYSALQTGQSLPVLDIQVGGENQVDDKGVGLQRWGMKNKSNAVIVLDADGKMLFAKDGPLSDIEIEIAIQLIENQMI